jgi:hypothetical protein
MASHVALWFLALSSVGLVDAWVLYDNSDAVPLFRKPKVVYQPKLDFSSALSSAAMR